MIAERRPPAGRVRVGGQAAAMLWRVLVLALLLAAAVAVLVLRLRQAPAPMTADEYASLYFSGRPFSDLWGWWMVRETNPPLFYSLLRLWRFIVPQSEAALRLLPLLLSLAQIALVARIAGRHYGALAAALCLVLFALSPSDIFQSEYVRGYVLAKLGATVSFAGLLAALGACEQPSCRHALRGWAVYVAGAVVAIYSHTTMLLWPAIASLAVLVETALPQAGGWPARRRVMAGLGLANLAVLVLSGWVLAIALVQLRTRAANIGWIQPLSLEDYGSSLNLQLLLDGTVSSALMAALVVLGLLRTARDRVTRMSAVIVAATALAFKAADRIHPVVSDYTLHWCATFTVLLAAAAFSSRGLPRGRAWQAGLAVLALLLLAGLVSDGLEELFEEVWIPEPQDFGFVLRAVARTPHAALLASHESVAVVLTEACMLEYHRPRCPFPLVILANPAQSDSWSFGGYPGPIRDAQGTRQALAQARTVYAFSRYVYTPLAQLGLPERRYRVTAWDDGALIGPIPARDFAARR